MGLTGNHIEIIKYLELNNYNYKILKLMGCNIFWGNREGRSGGREERRKINVISIQLKNLARGGGETREKLKKVENVTIKKKKK